MNSLQPSRRTIIVFTIILIIFGVLSRFAPHTWNFTPVAAIALAASVYVGVGYSVSVVLAIMALADVSLGLYEWQIMLAVYGSFVLAAFIGGALKRRRRVLNVLAASVASSLVFFIITNLAVWQFSHMYAHTAEGLFECFVAALPFYRGTFIGDLFFTGFFFVLCEGLFRVLATSRTRAVAM